MRTQSRKRRLAIVSSAIIAAACLAVPASLSAQGKSLTIAMSGSPDTLDPQKTTGTLTFQVDKSIYDTLVEPDRKAKIIPALAESWKVSEDGLTWTFKLRKGIQFHNGDPFTSKDVKATLDRVRDPATASPSASEYAAISGIETPDDYTVVLKLSRPSAPLLSSLASGWSAILPKSLIDSGWDFASKPVGTGPFVFKDWTRDHSITLERNPKYWLAGSPKVPGIVFDIVTERAVLVQGLLSGTFDFGDEIETADLDLLKKSPDIQVTKYASSLVLVLTMNTSRSALKDVRVRQAITRAIDKQKILDSSYGGGTPIGTFDDPQDPYYKDFTGLFPYDPAKAKAQLKEAGYDFDTVLDLVLPQNYPPHVKAGQIYQAYLEAVGIRTKIRMVDWSTWITDVYTNANFDLTVIGHTGKLDPDGRLNGYGTKDMYVRWENPKVASLIEQARGVVDFAARKKLYDQVEESFAREAPFVYLGAPTVTYVTRKNVTGFVKTPKLDTYDFRWTEKK
jgi:peptide/nickel transport system substrate-binding protein